MAQATKFLLLALAGCSSGGPWISDTIHAGIASFNMAKLSYVGERSSPPFHVEFVRMEQEVALFITSTRFPVRNEKVAFQIGEEPLFEEKIPLFEGGMKMRLPSPLATKITEALQDGKEVAILVDGMKETLRPEKFISHYQTFLQDSGFFHHPFKGPLE